MYALTDALTVSLTEVSEDDLTDCVPYDILTQGAAMGVYEASPAMQLVAAAYCRPSALCNEGAAMLIPNWDNAARMNGMASI